MVKKEKDVIERVETAIVSEAPTSRREFIKFSAFALSAVTMPAWLTACGGGGGGASSTTTAPPASSLRVAGVTDYMMIVADKSSGLGTVTVLDDYTVVGEYAVAPVGAIAVWRIFTPDGSVATIRMNTIQAVYDCTFDGFLISFRNYTATTVEVTVTAPDGSSETKVIDRDQTSLAKSTLTASEAIADRVASAGPYKRVASIADPDTWFNTEIEPEAKDMLIKEADAVLETWSLGVVSITKIQRIADKVQEIRTKVKAGLQRIKTKLDGGVTTIVHGSQGPFNPEAGTDTSSPVQMVEVSRKWGQAYRERLDGSTSGNIFADTMTRDRYMQSQYTDYSDWHNYSDWSNYSDWHNSYSDWSNNSGCIGPGGWNNAYSDWNNSWNNANPCCGVGWTAVTR